VEPQINLQSNGKISFKFDLSSRLILKYGHKTREKHILNTSIFNECIPAYYGSLFLFMHQPMKK